tara:strand:- start:226 stop:1053 length:828 start_codon:yes stop_codon:yes gene_type:complete
MNIYSFDNHIFENEIINKFIYTNIASIITNDNHYFSINIPDYNKFSDNILFTKKIEGLKYNDILIPDLYVNKFILIINNKTKNNSIITNIKLNNDFNNIYIILNFFINNIYNNLGIIYKLLINIQKSSYKTEKLYININTLDKISSHILFFDQFIYKIINFINKLDKKNEMNIILNDNISNIIMQINSLKFFYDSIKTTSIQKLTHSDANKATVLTYVATIFLPLSFIISIFSLFVKNIPFKNNEYALYFIIIAIIIIIIISSYYLIEFHNIDVF